MRYTARFVWAKNFFILGGIFFRWPGFLPFERRSKMTQVEKLVKIIMPDLLRYLEMVESGEIIQKRLDKRKNPSIHCDDEQELEIDGGSQCNQ